MSSTNINFHTPHKRIKNIFSQDYITFMIFSVINKKKLAQTEEYKKWCLSENSDLYLSKKKMQWILNSDVPRSMYTEEREKLRILIFITLLKM